MNYNFIILCLCILIILQYIKTKENFDIYNFNQPYYIKDNQYGYYLLIDLNLNVQWNYSYSNSGTPLFYNPLQKNNNYMTIERSLSYGNEITFLYLKGNKLEFIEYNTQYIMLLLDEKLMKLVAIINDMPNYLIVNEDGTYTFTTDTKKGSSFTMVPINSKISE